MDRRKNPYAPGAGIQPPALAGRDQLLADAQIDMERVLARRPVKSLMLLGLRGVGKTVLLNRMKADADNLDFQTAKIEAPEEGTLPQLLIPELRRILFSLDLIARAGKKLRQAMGALRNFGSAFRVSVGEIEIGMTPTPGVADTGNIEQDMPQLIIALCEAAAERNTAIGLFVDEVQYLSPRELAALVLACHETAQRNLPLFFVGAGLPQIAALAGNAKSYAERLFNYPGIDKLPPEAAREALTAPARKEGAAFESDAVEEILRVTERYPYFIQEWGYHVWNSAPKSPVTKHDVESAYPAIISHLDANFFRVRFDRLTVLQQKYLRAMAELGPGPHKTGDIAATLGVDATSVATVRQQLIDKGMIWSQRHGETAFTVPMFDRFMKRQIKVLEKHVPRRRKPALPRPL
ncbi:MAG: AAA family ATPase [Aestuariivirga sp.]|uniref:AAA family ATPase n=1 Tax=Aestuariivirga sp. TaxID=2650926 RepID=UPI0038D022C7